MLFLNFVVGTTSIAPCVARPKRKRHKRHNEDASGYALRHGRRLSQFRVISNPQPEENMKENFALFFKRVLEDEGTGFEDVPGDNGGPTKCGITIADVARFNSVRCPERDGPGWEALVAKVQALDSAQAGVIYKQFYWDSCRADFLPSGIDYSVVDYAVNSGTHRAIPVLGHIVGVPGSTVTDTMLDAVDKAIPRDVINSYQDERKTFLEHISQIPHNAKFRGGWLAREARVRRVALSLAFKTATDDATPIPGLTEGHPKAFGDHPNDEAVGIMPPVDALPMPIAPPHPVKVAAKSPTIWSLLIGAAATGINSIGSTVSDLFGHIPEISNQVDEFAAPSTHILGILRVNSPEIAIAVGVVCLAVAIIRHVDLHAKKGN